jgi:hypothetical protein
MASSHLKRTLDGDYCEVDDDCEDDYVDDVDVDVDVEGEDSHHALPLPHSNTGHLDVVERGSRSRGEPNADHGKSKMLYSELTIDGQGAGSSSSHDTSFANYAAQRDQGPAAHRDYEHGDRTSSEGYAGPPRDRGEADVGRDGVSRARNYDHDNEDGDDYDFDFNRGRSGGDDPDADLDEYERSLADAYLHGLHNEESFRLSRSELDGLLTIARFRQHAGASQRRDSPSGASEHGRSQARARVHGKGMGKDTGADRSGKKPKSAFRDRTMDKTISKGARQVSKLQPALTLTAPPQVPLADNAPPTPPSATASSVEPATAAADASPADVNLRALRAAFVRELFLSSIGLDKGTV